MTLSEFHCLRRNDHVWTVDENPRYGKDTYRVKGKAKFDPTSEKLIIQLVNTVIPSDQLMLSENNLNKFELIPYTKLKYSSPT